MSIASQLQALRILMPVMWMLFAVMASAVAVVYSKHAARSELLMRPLL